MKFFRVDNKKVVHFEHTEELATKLDEVIATLRTATAKLDPELGKYVKDMTPGPRKVKLGVKMALKNNGFDLKTWGTWLYLVDGGGLSGPDTSTI